MHRTQLVSALAIAAALAASPGAAHAAGFSSSVFAAGPSGTSGADSVEVIGNDVYVGYSNGTPKDGSGSGSSTIVEYSRSGQVLGSVDVRGHTDGLRYDAATGKIWSLQNEDANTNLVLITPGTLTKSSAIPIASLNAGGTNPAQGGFDDILFQNGKTFLSVSNPSNNPNTDPAIASATLSFPLGVGMVATTSVLEGNDPATSLNTGMPTTLNLQDPDSLSQTVDGRAVMTSQGDGQLLFISNLGMNNQSVNVLQLSNGVMVDDTVFGGTATSTLLVADKTTNEIYRITGPFNPNWGYSAAQDASLKGFIGAFDATGNPTSGDLATIVSGLGNPGGEAFLAAPEPATWGLMLVGFAGLGLLGYRNANKGVAKAA